MIENYIVQNSSKKVIGKPGFEEKAKEMTEEIEKLERIKINA